MNKITEQIKGAGLLPVVAIQDAEKAVPLAQALLRGGLNVAEITFRTAAAAQAIRSITAAYPEMLVGAGTVLSCEQVDLAVAAGAKFIVSPGFNPKVVRHAIEVGVPVFPGVATPGEMEQAMELGLETVKFFPASQSGGLPFLKAVSGPYKNLHFIPTGGISAANVVEYLSFNKVLACGGSWMVKSELIEAERFDEIERLTREAINTILGFEIAHTGINCSSAAQATEGGDFLSHAFGFEYTEGNSSVFSANRTLELMKAPGRGSCGHLAVRTNSIPRALYYLRQRGIEADETSAVEKEGKLIAIYLKQELAGFALHLLQK